MFTRIRVAAGLAFAAALMTSIATFAKGGFDFITITGPDLKEAIQVSDASLTQDFFAFANFFEDKTKAPADAGTGYEITRHYVQGSSDIIFDRLHYYPETGLVFYDGIENGESEYDGEWYTASSEIKPIFERAVSSASAGYTVQTQPRTPLFLFYLVALTTVGAALILLFTYRRRKSVPHE